LLCALILLFAHCSESLKKEKEKKQPPQKTIQ